MSYIIYICIYIHIFTYIYYIIYIYMDIMYICEYIYIRRSVWRLRNFCNHDLLSKFRENNYITLKLHCKIDFTKFFSGYSL